jgi:glycosyltransferase involved in cell wall biosynthesis
MKDNMKLVYLFRSRQKPEELSVINKVMYQQKALMKNSIECKVFSYDEVDIDKKKFEVEHLGLIKGTQSLSLLNKIIVNRKLSKYIYDAVLNERPDLIYIRDYFFQFNLYSKLSSICPVFVEIQTDILGEFKINNKKRYILEKFLGRRYFKDIGGLVCITKEILNKEQKFNNKVGFVLGNGIDEGEIQFVPKVDGNNLINLLFIGSPNMKWHGIERLIKSFEQASNKEKFMLHIVGYENKGCTNDDNIKFYGFVNDKNKIEDLFSKADIGIGTLALFKNDMMEAAPLKTRHYVAKGLPVIIGYDDVDLDEELPFVLKVPNNDSVIDFSEVERFYDKTKNIRKSGEISEFAFKYLTWDKKMSEVANFMINTVKSVKAK